MPWKCEKGDISVWKEICRGGELTKWLTLGSMLLGEHVGIEVIQSRVTFRTVLEGTTLKRKIREKDAAKGLDSHRKRRQQIEPACADFLLRRTISKR